MTKFRPCIDLHDGKVKQIVGGSLIDATDNLRQSTSIAGSAKENHVSVHPAQWFAEKYSADRLLGGHVIKLGPGNEDAAKSALAAYPNGLQIGGGITLDNASTWLELGASHVIVTSWLFSEQGKFLSDRLDQLVAEVGRQNIVIDLSCKRTASGWTVAMNRWQTLTDIHVDQKTLDELAGRCDEFLVHAADVEGLCQGIDKDLVEMLGRWHGSAITYAGGVASFADVQLVDDLSEGNVDITVGSALDLFGGTGVGYKQLIDFNQRQC